MRVRPFASLFLLHCSLWACSGCALTPAGTPKPQRLSGYDLCFVEGHALGTLQQFDPSVPSSELDTPWGRESRHVVRSGADRAVFEASARWGRSAFRSEWIWGSLLVELTLPLENGKVQEVAAESNARWSVGTMTAHVSRVRGRVVPLDVECDRPRRECDRVRLRVEIESVDGAERFAETVDVKRVQDPASCP
jgi:hypothetical protein